jgi:hypothetical protein
MKILFHLVKPEGDLNERSDLGEKTKDNIKMEQNVKI